MSDITDARTKKAFGKKFKLIDFVEFSRLYFEGRVTVFCLNFAGCAIPVTDAKRFEIVAEGGDGRYWFGVKKT